MFEQLLADVLNKVLGDYVSNLETNQLTVAIWSGNWFLCIDGRKRSTKEFEAQKGSSREV
jgi:hypothetical protein